MSEQSSHVILVRGLYRRNTLAIDQGLTHTIKEESVVYLCETEPIMTFMKFSCNQMYLVLLHSYKNAYTWSGLKH